MDISKSKLSHDPELRFLLIKFVAELPERVETLREAAKNEGWEEVSILAHRLKGTAGSYGLVEFSHLAAKIEIEIQTFCNKDRVHQLIEALAKKL